MNVDPFNPDSPGQTPNNSMLFGASHDAPFASALDLQWLLDGIGAADLENAPDAAVS
jgi:hypothetical protein